jgi:hypothetical protein
VFNGPDGYTYRWKPSNNSHNDIVVSTDARPVAGLSCPHVAFCTFQLQDQNNVVIAFYRPIRPVRYNIGDVYGELHFCRTAGAGVVVGF